ncbi:TPA: hypothetical protein IQP68_001121 [Listeria monocytogenes]|nr:hypothetical protein [Listeria monocytogenes]
MQHKNDENNKMHLYLDHLAYEYYGANEYYEPQRCYQCGDINIYLGHYQNDDERKQLINNYENRYGE